MAILRLGLIVMGKIGKTRLGYACTYLAPKVFHPWPLQGLNTALSTARGRRFSIGSQQPILSALSLDWSVPLGPRSHDLSRCVQLCKAIEIEKEDGRDLGNLAVVEVEVPHINVCPQKRK